MCKNLHICAYICYDTVICVLWTLCHDGELIPVLISSGLSWSELTPVLICAASLIASLTIVVWSSMWTPRAADLKDHMITLQPDVQRTCDHQEKLFHMLVDHQSMINQLCSAHITMTKSTQKSSDATTKSCRAARFVLDCASRAWLGCQAVSKIYVLNVSAELFYSMYISLLSL